MSANTSSSKKHEKDIQEQAQKTLRTIINEFILANLKQIGIAVLILVVLAIAFIAWNSYTRSLNEKASVLEYKARELYDEIDETVPTETAVAPEKSLQDVLALYLQIIEEYPGTESAERARYLSGNLEYTLGNYEAAQQYFETYISKHPKGKLRFEAEEGLAYIFEQQGEYQKAIDLLTRIEESAPSARKSLVTLEIGRNYENLEQTDKAIETYQRLIDSNTSGTWKEMARERLDILQLDVASSAEESLEEPPEEPEEESQEDENNS